MIEARMVKCPEYETSPYEHSMRDNCWTCAPYWETIPVCPVHGGKLRQTTTIPGYNNTGERIGGTKGYCRVCKKHYHI